MLNLQNDTIKIHASLLSRQDLDSGLNTIFMMVLLHWVKRFLQSSFRQSFSDISTLYLSPRHGVFPLTPLMRSTPLSNSRVISNQSDSGFLTTPSCVRVIVDTTAGAGIFLTQRDIFSLLQEENSATTRIMIRSMYLTRKAFTGLAGKMPAKHIISAI